MTLPSNFYDDVRNFTAELGEKGLNAWQNKINTVVEGASLGSEALMGVRFYLQELIKEESLSVEQKKRAKDFIELISQVLDN
ncbi:MAG: hypothetical protein JWN37_92 [Candidatus Nomurabacteria bacterium]|nr:hypothetical protein [Candidatus Nomurabacteria bacterium]